MLLVLLVLFMLLLLESHKNVNPISEKVNAVFKKVGAP